MKEIPNVKKILANDIDPKAVELIKKNVEFNNISVEKVVPHQGDAA
jgi:tRNA (guanine26-N2/guanine27-N2)-dimethyltransferase